ncbi:MAG: type II toxin-antitoxin system HicB family antitoxin [Verrucomicrobia bacterium]|jgi:predicted RNase H-like HicB family nuclease|nr:type II toxin-antitoxin system HicB family antitoxin [Verrucomicrobiota bacterium]
MNEFRYEVIIYWDKVDCIFVAEVPELHGCMAHGETKSLAVQNAEQAIELWIETAKEDGIAIPEPRGRLLYA